MDTFPSLRSLSCSTKEMMEYAAMEVMKLCLNVFKR